MSFPDTDSYVVQVLELKKKHSGTLLMFEVGYKDYFYGEDAQVCGSLSVLPARTHINLGKSGVVGCEVPRNCLLP